MTCANILAGTYAWIGDIVTDDLDGLLSKITSGIGVN